MGTNDDYLSLIRMLKTMCKLLVILGILETICVKKFYY